MDTHVLLHAVGGIVLVLLIASVVTASVPQVVGADHSYVVRSHSMQPGIDSGDVVIVREVDPATVRAGAVITFRSPTEAGTHSGTVVTHRVIDVIRREDGHYFRTKGDANENPDPVLVPADDIVGRVVLTIPEVGHLLLFAQTKTGLVTLVILPGSLLLLAELWSLVRAVGGDDFPDEA